MTLVWCLRLTALLRLRFVLTFVVVVLVVLCCLLVFVVVYGLLRGILGLWFVSCFVGFWWFCYLGWFVHVTGLLCGCLFCLMLYVWEVLVVCGCVVDLFVFCFLVFRVAF